MFYGQFAHNYKLKWDSSVLNVFLEVNQVMLIYSLRNCPSVPTCKMYFPSLTMKFGQHDARVFFNELFIKAGGCVIIFSSELHETRV